MAATADFDTVLMLRVREGDLDSFDRLLGRQRLPLIRFLFRMVQNQAIAEELAQEVFLRVYRARAAYEPTARCNTWLFRIASRLALNWIRDRKPERGHDSIDAESPVQLRDSRPTAETELIQRGKVAEVRAAIAQLPANQRAAVLLHKYEEMEYSQIAKALGVSESAVKSLLFRAYETLRVRLAKFA